MNIFFHWGKKRNLLTIVWDLTDIKQFLILRYFAHLALRKILMETADRDSFEMEKM